MLIFSRMELKTVLQIMALALAATTFVLPGDAAAQSSSRPLEPAVSAADVLPTPAQPGNQVFDQGFQQQLPTQQIAPQPFYEQSVQTGCDCGGTHRSGCSRCARGRRIGRGCRSCPQCEQDVCTLEVTKGEESKTCFKVEQKVVCIPAVRMPWKRNCPPTVSRSRTVSVLKRHKYKCPSCKYEWSLHEPEVSQPTPAGDAPQQLQPFEQPMIEQPAYEQPGFEQPAFEQPAFEQPNFGQPVYRQPSGEPLLPATGPSPSEIPAGSGLRGSVIPQPPVEQNFYPGLNGG